MKFAASLISLVSAASLASAALSCAEADRFGDLTVSPTTFKAGQTIYISTNLTCAVKNFDIVAQFIDYTIEVPSPNNNGFEAPIVLARRTIPRGALSDSFSVTVPHAFFVAGADYNIVLTSTYPINGTDGSPVLITGGVLEPVTIKT